MVMGTEQEISFFEEYKKLNGKKVNMSPPTTSWKKKRVEVILLPYRAWKNTKKICSLFSVAKCWQQSPKGLKKSLWLVFLLAKDISNKFFIHQQSFSHHQTSVFEFWFHFDRLKCFSSHIFHSYVARYHDRLKCFQNFQVLHIAEMSEVEEKED